MFDHFLGDLSVIKTLLQPRNILFGIAIFSGLSIIAMLVLQHFLDMEPCPLCISQRIFMIGAGLLALLMGLFARKGRTTALLSVPAIMLSIGGLAVAARHVWIQSLPEGEAPLCGPSLSYMFETRPMFDALTVLFAGDGHCSDINLQVLGLSLPGWALVAFTGFTLSFVYVGVSALRNKTK
ncbi:MAG: disulfide bond formation protein DsbB [Flavobacteriales bacterium]